MTKKKPAAPSRTYVYQVVLSKDGTTEMFATHYGTASSAQDAIAGAIARYSGVALHAKQVMLLGEKAF